FSRDWSADVCSSDLLALVELHVRARRQATGLQRLPAQLQRTVQRQVAGVEAVVVGVEGKPAGPLHVDATAVGAPRTHAPAPVHGDRMTGEQARGVEW